MSSSIEGPRCNRSKAVAAAETLPSLVESRAALVVRAYEKWVDGPHRCPTEELVQSIHQLRESLRNNGLYLTDS